MQLFWNDISQDEYENDPNFKYEALKYNFI